MHDTPGTFLHNIGLWRHLRNIRIRQLLLLIFGILSLITIMALAWNAIQVFYQYADAKQMARSNAVGQKALALNALLARERGFTAALLANRNHYDNQSRQRLDNLRAETSAGMQAVFVELDSYPDLPRVREIRRELDAVIAHLRDDRRRVDQGLLQALGIISHEDWIAHTTEHIETVAGITRLIMAPVDELDHARRYGAPLKEAFFLFSENAGRERALISSVIAQERPFTLQEYRQLIIYEHTAQMAEKQLQDMLRFFPQTEAIARASEHMKHAYKQDYRRLRDAVVEASTSGEAYPVDATEWFEQATEGVNAILDLARAADGHINQDIDSIKANSRNTVIALFVTVGLVIAVFLVAFTVTYRRILTPLRELERSANTIAQGNFSRSIRVMANDEFGEVAQAFEVMRNYLYHDRQQRQKAEDELRKLSTAIEQSVSSIIITDVNGIAEYVNPQFHHTTGYTDQDIIGHKLNVLSSGQTPVSTYTELWNTINSGRVWQGELLNKKKNGELYWELVSISPVRNRDGRVGNFIAIQHDITQRKSLEERLNFMAYHDELTDLPNRTLLQDRFKQLTTRARRTGRKVALLILDLDRFKLINDSLGHRIGDQLLVKVARRLCCTARSGDTIARYGGDEFVILASDFTEVQVPTDLAKRLVEAIARPLVIENHTLHVTASLGICIWPDDGNDMETLLRQADAAMYHAKDLGGRQFKFFTHELNQETSRRLRMEMDLRNAIDDEQLELYYQPQIHLASGRIIGAEALIRWNHPEFGLVSPIQFIPLAEDTGLIQPIGEWVLRAACEQLKKWQKAGYEWLTVAVNVSVKQLDNNDFVSRFTEIIDSFELAPSSLEIEITESSVMAQPERMQHVLNAIKKLGIKLALDDFGTGYSSLSYLRRFPFDKLKIDRSFVHEIANKPEDAAITQSISNMAHSLGMTVLAEGVERDIQVSYMRHCNCDQVQGYLISPPVPAAEFEHMVRQSKRYTGSGERDSEHPAILIVDGQPGVRQTIRSMIQEPWLQVFEADNGFAALDVLCEQPIQVVLSDYHLPTVDGISLFNRIRDLYPEVLRVAFAGDIPRETIVRATNEGSVHHFLLKPWSEADLRAIVLEAFQAGVRREIGL